jgi:hypothetical protein
MSVAPIRFPGKEKELPFDVAAIRRIISDLLVHTADEVESEQIEIKGWCNNDRELADKVAEACACLANTSGGFVIVGVADGVNAGSKFSVCPYSEVNTGWFQTNVYNRTRPPSNVFHSTPAASSQKSLVARLVICMPCAYPVRATSAAISRRRASRKSGSVRNANLNT